MSAAVLRRELAEVRRAVEAAAARLEALEAMVDEPAPARPDGGDRWLSTREAADYLGLHPKTLSNYASAGEVPSVQRSPRGRRYFRRSDLDRWREQWLPAEGSRLRLVR